MSHKPLGLVLLLAVTLVGTPIASALDMQAGRHSDMAGSETHCIVPTVSIESGVCDPASHADHHSGHADLCLDDCAACVSAATLPATGVASSVAPKNGYFVVLRHSHPGRTTHPLERPPARA